MELRQLRYFVAIAEEHHFGRAAHRLKIATPTLSQQLRVLERSLGVTLVDRSLPGRASLSPSGEVLLRHARALITRADRAEDEVRRSAGQPEQVLLRVAPGAERLLASQLRRLTDDAALGVITMSSSTSDAILAVREEVGDAAIVWDGRGETQGLTTTILQEVAVHLAVPPSHRFAEAAYVDVADVVDEQMVMFPRLLCPHGWDRMQRHLVPDGPSRPSQIVTETNATGPLGVLRAVRAGKGIAPVVDVLDEQAHRMGVVLVPLRPPLTLPLELAWREPSSDAVRQVIDFLRSECGPGAAVVHDARSRAASAPTRSPGDH